MKIKNLSNIVIDRQKLTEARGERSFAEVGSAVGLTRQHIYNYENGYATPRADVLARLCILYKVPIHRLTSTTETPAEE